MEEILQPIYRIEDYWYAIANGLSCPHTPIYRIETYLAYLCGADVSVPQPIYRIEQYLAYKCGLDVELPAPIYRQEMFLAKWCGLEVDTPEPIYRIEYWLNLLANPAGELKTVTGNPISISDALAKPAESLTIEILPQQDLHGYDNPWPAGGGKNIGYISADNIYSQQRNINVYANNGVTVTSTGSYGRSGFSIPVVTGETYTVSMKAVCSGTISRLGLDDGTSWACSYGTFNVSATKTTFTKTLTATSDTLALEVYPSVEGSSITIEDFQVEKGSSATSFATYSNICPISGFTGVNIYHESAYDPDADPTYSIDWTDDAGTVYGGTLDVTTGVLTVTKAYALLNDSSLWAETTGTIDFIYRQDYSDRKKYANSYDGLICSYIQVDANASTNTARWNSASGERFGIKSSALTLEQIQSDATAGKIAICYELATHLTYQLTPTEIEMLEGNNTLWADTGDITVTYMADGNANDVEALNILLGNRYVNLGEPDEATDREALQILLGK